MYLSFVIYKIRSMMLHRVVTKIRNNILKCLIQGLKYRCSIQLVFPRHLLCARQTLGISLPSQTLKFEVEMFIETETEIMGPLKYVGNLITIPTDFPILTLVLFLHMCVCTHTYASIMTVAVAQKVRCREISQEPAKATEKGQPDVVSGLISVPDFQSASALGDDPTLFQAVPEHQ